MPHPGPRSLAETLLRWLASRLAPFIPPRPPARPAFLVVGQSTNQDTTMILSVSLPPKTASDVAGYELSYSIDGGPGIVATSAGDPVTFNAPVGAVVAGTWVEIDASGNRSDPSEVGTFTVTDSIAPPVPAAPVFAVVGQEDAAPPVA